MAYSNKADAISKLTSGLVDNDSSKIYTSDTNYNSNTIFYSNAAKTQLLPAGNYVLLTNYRTLWVVIGNDGKIVGTPEFLFDSAPETSWANDKLYNTDPWVNPGRTSVSYTNITISNNLITDTYWADNTYPGYSKQWSCNMGAYNTSAMTNIDVSEMKGFDLMFYTGAYGGFRQYIAGKARTFFVHVGQNINRQTIFIENGITKIYYFKSDYWYAKENVNSVTFFRRTPTIQVGDLKNQYGLNKSYDSMEDYTMDILYLDKQTPRTSTRKQRSLLDLENFYGNTRYDTTDQIAYGTVPTFYNRNVSRGYGKSNGIRFDQPICITESFAANVGRTYVVTDPGAPPFFSYDNIVMTAMFRSMYLEQFTGTWTQWGMSTTYQEANPLQWTCGLNTPSQNNNPNHPIRILIDNWQAKPRGWYWDMENYAALYQDDIGMRGLLECAKISRNYCVANNLLDSNQKIVWYADGVYRVENYYQIADINSSNYTTAPLYLDYAGYMTGAITRQQLQGGYRPVIYDYAELGHYSFVLNYIHEYNPKYYFYLLCHSTDITRKLLNERFGNNNHGVKVSVYSWTMHDVLGAESELNVVINWSTGLASRADHSPDFFQSLGAWGFGYADGVYQWNYGSSNVEDLDDFTSPLELDNYLTGASAPINNFASEDWVYWTQYTMFQNKDIIEASTEWIYANQDKGGGLYTSGSENYPMALYAFQRPIITMKFNSAGTEALILAINPWNNGYTKSSKNIKLPNNTVISIDMWGNYTTIVRIKL